MTRSRNLLKKWKKGTRGDQQPVQHCGRKNKAEKALWVWGEHVQTSNWKWQSWGPSFGIMGGKDSSVSLQSYKIITKKKTKNQFFRNRSQWPDLFLHVTWACNTLHNSTQKCDSCDSETISNHFRCDSELISIHLAI